MSSIPPRRAPADVLVERVAASLRAAHAYHVGKDYDGAFQALTEARGWLEKLREELS